MNVKSFQSGANIPSTPDFESPVQDTSRSQVQTEQTSSNQSGTPGPAAQQVQNSRTTSEAGAAQKASMRLEGKMQEFALRHRLSNPSEFKTNGSETFRNKNLSGLRQVMLATDGAQKFSQIKPVLSEMISRLPGGDSHMKNLKANLHGLLQMVNIDPAKSKIEPSNQDALNRFIGSVSKAAASIKPNSTTPIGTTVKNLIAEVKSSSGSPLPKHVDDALGKVTDLLDKAHAEGATTQKHPMDEAATSKDDGAWWKTAGATSAVAVGVVSAVTGAFTFGGAGPAVLPAAVTTAAGGTLAGGISAATATFGAAAATASVGASAVGGVVTTTLAAGGGAAAAAAFAAMAPVLSTAAAAGVLGEVGNAVTGLLDSLW